MQKFGYLDQDGPQALTAKDELVTALKLVQKFGGLEQTGIIDNDTLKVCTLIFNYGYDYSFDNVILQRINKIKDLGFIFTPT